MNTKPAIILLHGALGTETQMRKIEERFMTHYKVYRFTFYGHGKSDEQKSFSINGFVDQLRSFIDAHHLTKFSIFGYSMGGYVALKYAMEKNHGLENVFTFGTKFNWSKEIADHETKFLNPELMEAKVPQFVDWLKEMHGEENWKKVVFNTAELMNSLGKDNPLVNDDLSNIQCLVTVSVGDLDKMATVDDSRDVVSRLNHGRLKVLKEVGHDIATLTDHQIDSLLN